MSAIKIWNLIEITLHVFKTHIFENLEDNTGENLKINLSLVRLECLRSIRQKLY